MLDCSTSKLAQNRFGNDRQVNKRPATELTIAVTVTYCVVLTTHPVTWIYTNKSAGRAGWSVITWSNLDALLLLISSTRGSAHSRCWPGCGRA